MDENEVQLAFDILLEEVEMVANGLDEDAASALQKREYAKAREFIDMAANLSEFRIKVKNLQNEWRMGFRQWPTPARSARKRGRGVTRLKRGLRTPEDTFRLPILRALAQLVGRAPIDAVLQNVEGQLKGNLNEYDYQQLPSGQQIRWRN